MVIWLIDDDETFNFLSEKIVKASGYFEKVTVFLEPEKALGEITKKIKKPEELPDLILLDIMMPRMNGFQFLEKFSAIKKNSLTKVAMVTSSLEETDKKRAFEFDYVFDFIAKPFTRAKLEDVVRNFHSTKK